MGNVWKRNHFKQPANVRWPVVELHSFKLKSLGHFLKAHDRLLACVRWHVSRTHGRHLVAMSQRTDTPSILVETVRVACLDAARLAYEDAGIRGLCADGRWEAALAAIRHLDLSGVLEPPAGSTHVDESA